MKIEIGFLVYAVWDGHDNFDSAVVDESCETIQITGMKSKNGDSLHFESDAYHLENWCNENNLEYQKHESSYFVEN